MKKRTLLTLLMICMVATASAKTRKTLFVIIDGIPATYIERLQPPTLMEIARQGHYHRAFCGGEPGMYNETPTISAVGYTNILTGTWVNKHNVWGNDNIKANYNYPTIFRIAKDQTRPVSTAIYSSWTDNRTILLGEGRDATRNLTIDYTYDGYDNDQERFPHQKDDLHVRAIDGQVCKDAAACISQNAPDLNWLYLWYTDDAFHINGGGSIADEAVMNVDYQLSDVWKAIREREQKHDEEWLVIVTTDHGRDHWSRHHGKQSEYERTVWIITNQRKLNRQFFRPTLSQVDINPTICQWMGFDVAQDVAFERDGISFIGTTDIYNLKATAYNQTATLTWQHDGKGSTTATVYIATTNNFSTGTPDRWIKVADVPARQRKIDIDLKNFENSKLYKFVVKTPSTTLTRWLPRT